MLDNGYAAPPSKQQQSSTPPPPSVSKPTHAPSNSVSGRTSITTRQPQAQQLLSANYTVNAQRQTTAVPVSPPSITQDLTQQPTAPENDIFSLDFRAPPVTASQNQSNSSASQQVSKKDIKQDILSLYSSAATTPPTYGQLGGAQASTWGSHAQPQSTSMLGNNGPGMWGASSGWTGAPAVPPAQGSLWGSSSAAAPGLPQQGNLFNTNDVWGSSTSITAPDQDPFSTYIGGAVASQKKDDIFGDLWGGFK